MRHLARFLVTGFLSSFATTHVAAQTADNVLMVVNDATPAGDRIARQYVERRGLPAANICHINSTSDEAISRADYERQIEGPIWRCIVTAAAHDRILYIVLTKGVPIRIEGTTGRAGTVSSVDSELTLLYRRGTGQPVPVAGFVANPYFHSSRPLSDVKPFTHELVDTYLVTRLDGYTVDDALALIDRSVTATRDGRFILDERTSWNDRGNNWLRTAAQRLRASGFGDRVLLDESGKVVTNESRVIGYYSWGSNDPAIRMRRFGFGFVPGALASMFVSTDGRTFKEPPAEWTPGEWTNPKTFFVNSPQSLAADLIRDGVTGIAGHVAEPYLEAAIRPDILFPAYTRGLNLAESFYAAMPYLSWQTIVIGDPLCAPFRDPETPAVTIETAVDQATELPTHYSQRRQAGLSRTAAADAVQAYLKAEARAARGDAAGSREALERAVTADPRFTAARLVLAAQHERADEHQGASVQYRAILEYAPNDPVSLNNLAYNLVVYDKKPEEALPLAERAIKVTPGSAAARDTLAWTQHLLGRDAAAAANIALARDGAKESAEIRWHAAFIYAAINDLAQAAMELEAALKLDPTIANRTELLELRERLSTVSPSR